MNKHREARKLWKKLRRKHKRQINATKREKLLLEHEERRSKSPSYQSWLKSQQELEEFEEKENERIAIKEYKKWEEREQCALQEWDLLQKKLEKIKHDKAKKELMIKNEWEREQNKIKEENEKQIANEKLRIEMNKKFMEEIEMYMNGLGPIPESIKTGTNTRPDQPLCPFFSKVAACRFRDNCSRNHSRPGISDTLLIPNFYKNFELNMRYEREFDIDIGLECDEKEAYQKFYEFYDDILPELKSYGQIIELNVCRNQEPHLMGNVYIQYRSKRYALRAYRSLCGRYYGGRQIIAEFCNIPSWSEAVCGLFFRKMCPKGKNCNYLHLYRNPACKYQSKPHRKYNDGSSHYEDIRTSSRRDHGKHKMSKNNEEEKKNNSSKRIKNVISTSERRKKNVTKWEDIPEKTSQSSQAYNWSSDDD
ncbi:U2 small nuclear ribonucleoprotein auxiliary factor 35 kDa subunit-related protein 2 [Adelges cooleyi]|uniref:U2 small nuclear ribonucleoprotein auxiliary factor 35 kDa subunit-related protein 2 n=1 Tax=Adelges cooleyi TaxID=133065 RepID=UPI0021808417|nr:U2 small nuclear ribonucleoprotein auxiliary factor 35 kDa subunit-related protein 2 [Adelges cooleyi]